MVSTLGTVFADSTDTDKNRRRHLVGRLQLSHWAQLGNCACVGEEA